MSADDTRALRLLAAADRVREAAAVVATADVFRTEARSALERKAAKLGCDIYDPRVSSLQHVSIATERGHRETCEELEAAIADLTAIALEPGDCAWALGVLGAAARVGEADATVSASVRAKAALQRKFDRVYEAVCTELGVHSLLEPQCTPLINMLDRSVTRVARAIMRAQRAVARSERALLAAARGAR